MPEDAKIMIKYTIIALSIVALGWSPVAPADGADAGRKIFVAHCQSCHGVTGPADSKAGPDLTGVYGRRVGDGNSGVHSRALHESNAVWDRESLRKYLSDAPQAVPGTLMAVRIADREELEALLDFLQTLH